MNLLRRLAATTESIFAAMACAIFTTALVATASAQDPAAEGRKIAQVFCSPCHAIGKTGASPRVEAPPFRTLSRTFELDRFPELLERGFSSNHPDMPEFKFNEEEARAMRAYLRTIQE